MLLVHLVQLVNAQEYQWASEVIEVSSEYYYDKYPQQYKADQILGKPSVEPSGKFSVAAWTPATEASDEEEFITVGFQRPQHISQVILNENMGAGTVCLVSIIGETADTVDVYKNEDPGEVKGGRKLQVLFPRTEFKVKAVHVRLATNRVSGFNQLDCIGIADHEESPATFIHADSSTFNLQKEKLSRVVNSDSSELLPVISPDGETIYVVRLPTNEMNPRGKQDIWKATLINGKAANMTKLPAPLNTDKNNALLSISPDGNTALLLNIYREDGTNDPGISYSRKDHNGKWRFPKALNIVDYYNDNKFGEYCLSNSGKVLVMAVQRKEGYGSKDLYVSFLQADSSWSKPENLGVQLNTTASEISPFLAADDHTLYFSSSGHPGYGGSDMFVTTRLDSTWKNWSKPMNLGPILNSDEFDAYYTIPASGDYAYFSSSESGNPDIYRVKLTSAIMPSPVNLVQGVVYDSKTGKPLSAEVKYYDLKKNEQIGSAITNSLDGRYKIVLPTGTTYGFNATKQGYIPNSASLELPDSAKYKTVVKDLYLTPIEKGARIVVNNVYFDYDKATLRPESRVELDQLAKLMQANPNMSVQIEGHTDDRGDDQYNLRLSGERAKAVVDYLVVKGISIKKVEAKAKGESVPVESNDTPEGRQKNRRVEFVVAGL